MDRGARSRVLQNLSCCGRRSGGRLRNVRLRNVRRQFGDTRCLVCLLGVGGEQRRRKRVECSVRFGDHPACRACRRDRLIRTYRRRGGDLECSCWSDALPRFKGDKRNRREDRSRRLADGHDLSRCISRCRNGILVFCPRRDIVHRGERKRLQYGCAGRAKGCGDAFLDRDRRRSGNSRGGRFARVLLHGDVQRRHDTRRHADMVCFACKRGGDRRKRRVQGRKCHG